ncbi:8990_t:CDS:2, partial [Entrophospora sp. SA101]
DDTSRSNSERSERRYSRSSNTGSSGVNNNNNNIEKAATTWGETANLDNVAWGNYDLKFIVKGKEQLQNKTTLSQMQSSWPTQTVTASTTSDTVPPAKKWRLASPKNYDPNKRIIVGFSDAMFNVWMKRKTGRCM